MWVMWVNVGNVGNVGNLAAVAVGGDAKTGLCKKVADKNSGKILIRPRSKPHRF